MLLTKITLFEIRKNYGASTFALLKYIFSGINRKAVSDMQANTMF